MTSLRLPIAILIIVMSPSWVWAQVSVESIPNLDPSTTFVRDNFFSRFYTYFIFASIGAIVIASGFWYKIYNKKHQHPYKFLEAMDKSSAQLVEEGKIEEAIAILNQALYTVENDLKKFPAKCQSRNGTIWMLKRKISDLKELLIDH